MSSFVKKLITLPFAAGILVGVAATGIAAGTLGSDIFPDVQRGAYYDSAVGEMYDMDIINGYDNGKFGPNDYVTRGQVAVMFQRLMNEIDGGGSRSSSRSVADEEEEEESSSSQSSSSVASVVIPPEGSIRFTAKSFTVNETATTATISVVRTNGNAGAVSVDYKVLSGSATSGTDYTLTAGTVNFGARETSKTFTVAITDDTTSEGTESVAIQLHNAKGGAILGTPVQAQLNIVDNESGGSASSTSVGSTSSAGHEVSFNAGSYAISENGSSIAITVKRTGGTGPVTVNYALTNGTAVLGTEYNTTGGSVTFDGSDTLKTFTVDVLDDSAIDGNKNLTMTLSSPTGGAKLGNPSTAMLTIIDNEAVSAATGSLKFSSATYAVSEGQAALVTVSRVGGTVGSVSVNYSTGNGVAQAGTDYTAVSGTLTFQAGEASKIFSVPTLNDGVASEGQETFSVTISNPTGRADLLSPTTASVRIDG